MCAQPGAGHWVFTKTQNIDRRLNERGSPKVDFYRFSWIEWISGVTSCFLFTTKLDSDEGCPKKTNIVSILLNLLHSYTIPSYVYRSNINIFKSLCLTDGTSSIALQRASSVGIVNKHFVVIGNNWSPLLVLDQSSLANFPRHKVCTPPNTFQHPDMWSDGGREALRSVSWLGCYGMCDIQYWLVKVHVWWLVTSSDFFWWRQLG